LELAQKETDRFFAFTKEWREVLKRQNVTRPIDVLLHGYDPSLFPALTKQEARKRMNIPEETFLFMSLNRNQPRKRLDLLIMAFADLIMRHPTKPLFLMCVCDTGDKGGGFPLFEIFRREIAIRGLPVDKFANRLLVTPKEMNYQDEEIGRFYKIADVGVSTADGEGFGLCQFEQMGVGVPQVVPDIGGFKEFCTTENSSLVKSTVRYYLPNGFSPVGGEAHACQPHDVCVAMEEYVLNSEKREEHGKRARATVLPYTWKNSCEILIKRLKMIEEDS
jgi:glycosyltransferase involved in cell wall biosynthesis